MGHQLGCAVIMDVAIVIFWNACIAFRNDWGLRAGGRKPQDRSQKIGCPHATIGTKGEWFVWNFVQKFHHLCCRGAHHCAPSRVKAHRANPGQICEGKGLSCGAVLIAERDRFDPSHICATGLQTLGLLVENFHGHSIGEWANGLHYVTCWADGAGDNHLTTGGICYLPTDLRRDARQFGGACLGTMKF